MVFFDVGGTLVRRNGDEVRQVCELLAHLDLAGTPTEVGAALAAMAHAYHVGVYAPVSAAGERGLWRALATVLLSRLPSGDPALVGRLAEALGRYTPWYEPIPDTAAMLAELRARGLRVGIISNWLPSLERFLREVGLGSFEVLACSGPLGLTKPDPAIFRWAVDRAGVPADEAWYVGNDPNLDYAAARAAGLHAVLWDPERRAAADLVRAGTLSELRAALAAAR